MARPTKYVWPVADNQAVCLPQQLGAAGNLIINGTLSVNEQIVGGTNSSLTSNYFANFPGIARAVTITSTGNLLGINFTITGYIDSVRTTSVTIAGPNNGTVSTATVPAYFTKVTSVTASAAVGTNVSVGTGTVGWTLWFRNDYNRIKSDLTVAVEVGGTINYTFEITLDDVDSVASPTVFDPIDGVTIPTVPAATAMSAATTSIVSDYFWPTNASRIHINSSDGTGTITAYFLQQGIT